jgi:hypothetical protein
MNVKIKLSKKVNIFFITLFSFVLSISYGQTWDSVEESDEPQPNELGITLKVGMELKVVEKKPYQFLYTKSPVIFPTKKCIKSGVVRDVDLPKGHPDQFSPYLFGFPSYLTKTQIKKFYICKRSNGDKKVYALGTAVLFTLLIDIDQAFASQEVSLLIPEAQTITRSKFNPLDPKTAYALYAKQQKEKSKKEIVEEYLCMFNPQICIDDKKNRQGKNEFAVRQNEIDYKKKIEVAEKQLDNEVKGIESFDFSKKYHATIKNGTQLGKYDFDKQAFPLTLYEWLEIVPDPQVYNSRLGVNVTGLKVNFTNCKDFPTLPMSEAKAAALMPMLNDRVVYVEISYVLEKDNLITSPNRINARMTSILFYKDNSFLQSALISELNAK